MSTPEEVQQKLLEAMQSMADMTKLQLDMAQDRLNTEKKQNEERKKQHEEEKKLADKKDGLQKVSLEDEKEQSKRIAISYKNRLGIEEEINPKLKKVLDNRFDVEQRIVDQARKKYGDEVFEASQRNKFFREQLETASKGNLAYGGVVTNFKDLNATQQKQLLAAANTQQKLKKAQEDFTSTVQKLANPGDAFKDLKGKVTSFGGVMDQSKDSLIKMAGGGIGAQVVFDTIFVAGNALAAGFMSMSKSLADGQRGAAVGVGAMAAAVDKVTPLLYGLGAALLFLPGVGIIGAAIKVLGVAVVAGVAALDLYTEAQKKGAEQNDALFKSFNDLSSVGLTTTQGLTGLFDMTQKLGLTIKEIDKLGPLLKANAKDLRLFGGTVADGADAFANVAQGLKNADIGEQLARLGIVSDEQREHTLKYMAQQTRMGLTLNKTQSEQIAGAKNYMEELDKTASLLGASRKDQETAREAILAEDQLRAAMFKAEQEGDTQKLEKLQSYFELAVQLKLSGNADAATGTARYAALGGPTDEKSAAAMLTLGSSFNLIESGERNQTKILQEASHGIKDALGKMALTKAAGGDVSGYLSGSFAGNVDFTKGIELAEKRAAEKGISLSDALRELQKEKQKSPEAQLAANVSADRIQQAAAMLQDSVVKQFDQSAIINKKASEVFKTAVNEFSKTVGVKPPEGGTPQVEKPAPSGAPAQSVPAKPAGKFSGFGKENDKNITNASKRFGMDEKVMRGFVKMEAGYTGKMSPTGAIGIGQFTEESAGRGGQKNKKGEIIKDGTWNSLAKTPEGIDIGMRLITPDNFRTDRDPRYDQRVNMMATALLAKNNAKLLEAAGMPASGENLYMMHNIGPGFITAMQGGTVSQKTLDAMGHNGMKPGQSPADFVKMQKDRFNNHMAQANSLGSEASGGTPASVDQPVPKLRNGGVVNGPDSGFPVELHGSEVVAPLNPSSLLAQLMLSPASEAANKIATTTTSTSNPMQDSMMSMTTDMISMLSTKLDTVIEQLSSGNYTQEKMLQYARA